MTCTACVGRMKSALEAVEGAWSALANIRNSTMTVVFDKSRVTDEHLAYSMRGVNYQVIIDDRIKTAKQELKALNVQRRDLLISMVLR